MLTSPQAGSQIYSEQLPSDRHWATDSTHSQCIQSESEALPLDKHIDFISIFCRRVKPKPKNDKPIKNTDKIVMTTISSTNPQAFLPRNSSLSCHYSYRSNSHWELLMFAHHTMSTYVTQYVLRHRKKLFVTHQIKNRSRIRPTSRSLSRSTSVCNDLRSRSGPAKWHPGSSDTTRFESSPESSRSPQFFAVLTIRKRVTWEILLYVFNVISAFFLAQLEVCCALLFGCIKNSHFSIVFIYYHECYFLWTDSRQSIEFPIGLPNRARENHFKIRGSTITKIRSIVLFESRMTFLQKVPIEGSPYSFWPETI